MGPPYMAKTDKERLATGFWNRIESNQAADCNTDKCSADTIHFILKASLVQGTSPVLLYGIRCYGLQTPLRPAILYQSYCLILSHFVFVLSPIHQSSSRQMYAMGSRCARRLSSAQKLKLSCQRQSAKISVNWENKMWTASL